MSEAELSSHPRYGRIACAAINIGGIVYSKPAPARHGDIAKDILVEPTESQYGFLTDAGVWVNRQDALRIAHNAGQLIRSPSHPFHGLYTNDVW